MWTDGLGAVSDVLRDVFFLVSAVIYSGKRNFLFLRPLCKGFMGGLWYRGGGGAILLFLQIVFVHTIIRRYFFSLLEHIEKSEK